MGGRPALLHHLLLWRVPALPALLPGAVLGRAHIHTPSCDLQLFAFLGVATTNIIASNSLKAAGLDAKAL